MVRRQAAGEIPEPYAARAGARMFQGSWVSRIAGVSLIT